MNLHAKRDRTARLLRLQVLLWQYPHGIDIKKIAEVCSVSERTAYRDLKTLESELNVPIWEEGNKRGILQGHFLPPISFSLEEATTIFLAARMMQNYFYLYDIGTASTFMKLNVVVPSPLREQIQNIINHLDMQPKDKRKTDNLKKIIGAWLSQHRVKMIYQERYSSSPVERIIDPYFIEPGALGYGYYIIAYCHHEKAIRTFKIDLVMDVFVSNERFIVPSGFNALDYLGSAWGSYVDADVETVKLHFSKKESKAAMSTIWHPSQETEIQKDGSVVMTLKVRLTSVFCDWVIGWGSKVKVLEPETLKNKVIGNVRSLVDMYFYDEASTKFPTGIDTKSLFNTKELTDHQWELIAPILPGHAHTGRPRKNDKKTINGILWVLSRNAKWHDMPRIYGSPSTCHSRFQVWQKTGVWRKIAEILAYVS